MEISAGWAGSLGYIWSRLAFSKYPNYWKIAGLRPAIFSGTPGNFKDLINVAQLHLGQGTISTRLPFHDRMVGVITLNLQKKCILVAKKGCNLQWKISYALLFFEKNFLFLNQFFLFLIWTAKGSNPESNILKFLSPASIATFFLIRSQICPRFHA